MYDFLTLKNANGYSIDTSRPLRVGLGPYKPYVNPCIFDKEKPCLANGGFNVDIVRAVAQMIGFKEIKWIAAKHTRDQQNGSDPRNWNGFIGQIHRNEVDITGFRYLKIQQDLELADVSLPVNSVQAGIVLHRYVDPNDESINEANYNLWATFSPFPRLIWGYLTLFIVTSTALKFVQSSLSPKLAAGGCTVSRSSLLHAVIVSVACFFLWRAYKSGKWSSLIVHSARRHPFHNFDYFIGQLKAGRAKVIVDRRHRANRVTSLQQSVNHSYEGRIYQALRRNPIKTVGQNRKQLMDALVRNPNYVAIQSSLAFAINALPLSCQLQFISWNAEPIFLTFQLPKGSPLLGAVNMAMYRESLSINQFYQTLTEWHFRPKTCSKTEQVQRRGPMKLFQFYSALVVYAFIVLACSFLFAVELIHFHHFDSISSRQFIPFP